MHYRGGPLLMLAFIPLAAGLLSGCMVLQTEVSWRPSPAEMIRQDRQRPCAQVEVSRRPHLLILPFVFVSYANRGYGLGFHFSSPRPVGTLDSLHYTLYDGRGHSLATGRATLGMPLQRPRHGAPSGSVADSLHFGAHTTPYTLRLPMHQDSVLRVDFQLYATDATGQARTWRYNDYRLQRHGWRFGSFL